ncbi:MAG TPA: TRAP transporter large permease subunit, partial [Rhodospirillales bacterium]|nr:TRAP transporter large permease subunit [Rhodospirillales bacterium]
MLGMGMPTPSAYIMSAVLVGPVLIDMGIPALNAHMFLLFFAALSAITPPVAVAAYAAASIAQANPIVIAGLAVRLAIAGFTLPFAFAVDPGLLAQGSLPDIIWAAATTLLGVVGLSIAAEGFLDRQ